MIVTCEKNYRVKCSGNGWQLYSDVSMKDSLIVHALERLVIESAELSFLQVCEALKERYKNKTERSRCAIRMAHEGFFEVSIRSSFPVFYILQNESQHK